MLPHHATSPPDDVVPRAAIVGPLALTAALASALLLMLCLTSSMSLSSSPPSSLSTSASTSVPARTAGPGSQSISIVAEAARATLRTPPFAPAFVLGADVGRRGLPLQGEPDGSCARGGATERACPDPEELARTGTGAAGLTSGVLVLVAAGFWVLRRVRENRLLAGKGRRNASRDGRPPTGPMGGADPVDRSPSAGSGPSGG